MTRAENADASWAAFNVETAGDQFDFKVALGGRVTGFRRPSRLTSFDRTALLLF
jgi:hypothetical protein